MKSSKLIAVGGALMLGLAGTARADEPSTAELLQKIQQLEQRVSDLQGHQDGNWLNERRQEEVKALVREVLSDADTRASLQAEGLTAGHNGSNFFLSSADGGFTLNISGYIQARYIANFRDEGASGIDDVTGEPIVSSVEDEEERGFEVTRAKIQFDGHISDPRFGYILRLAVDRNTNAVHADRIVISYELADGVTLWVGEDKARFLREENIEPTHQLAVERSLVNEFFTLGYVQGVGLNFDQDMFRAQILVSDGARSGENGAHLGHPSGLVLTDEFGDPVLDPITGEPIVGTDALTAFKAFHGDRSDFAITARIDIKLMGGDWEQWEQFTAPEDGETTLFVGGAIHWEVGETGDSFANTDFLSWTVDASFTTMGLNLYGAVVGIHTDTDDNIDDADVFGFLAQAGYKITPELEPFIRYEHMDLDDLDADDLNLLTFGINYYINRQQTKFSLDVVWALDPLPSGLGDLGLLGLLPDDSDEDDQFALRAQLQLMF